MYNREPVGGLSAEAVVIGENYQILRFSFKEYFTRH
jgi:hypothetical protein